MNLLDQLKNKLNNYNNINVCFGKQINEHQISTLKLDAKLVTQIRNDLRKKTKNKYLCWEQIESSFNNIMKVEKQYSNGALEITYESKSLGELIMTDNNKFIIMENIKQIEKGCFPLLDQYDIVTNKSYEKYCIDNFDILLITQNEKTIICIKINNINNLNKLDDIVKTFHLS